MNQVVRRATTWAILLCTCVTLLLVRTATAQSTQGFDNSAKALATGTERKAQNNLFVLEVNLKPPRMISVDITDPKTGIKKRNNVWYLCYRAIRRQIEQKQDQSDTTPRNIFDPPPTNPTTGKLSELMFLPEFTLVTDDNGIQNIYDDEILPEAQAAIMDRERQVFQNSVEIVGPIPPITAVGATKLNARYGVAMWRGIDPETDHFTIFMTGFSNGYKLVYGPVSYQDLSQLVKNSKLRISDQVWNGTGNWLTAGELGNLFDARKIPPPNAIDAVWYYTTSTDRLADGPPPQIWRKTLIQKYWRPGDQFDENETEFRQDDHQGNTHEPTWIYRPDNVVFQPLDKPENTKLPGKDPDQPNNNIPKPSEEKAIELSE